MKYTLLEMVQDILSSMDSDEVNSLGDTIEAQQVATIVKNCYNDITTDVEFPEQYGLFQLDPSLDSSRPCVMYIPEAFENLEWIRYNKIGRDPDGLASTPSWLNGDGLNVHFGQSEASFSSGSGSGSNFQQFREIAFLPREQFLDQVLNLNSLSSNVLSYKLEGIPLLCRKDKQPDYWTVLSNRTIVFDSYDRSVDSTLQSSKTLGYGKKATTFVMLDDWIPPLDGRYLSYLFNEAKATAFAELKQQTNPRAEKAARRAKIKTMKSKPAVPYEEPAHNNDANYGRRYTPNHYRKGYYT